MLKLIKIYTGVFLFLTSVMGLIFCYRLIHPAKMYLSGAALAKLSSIVFLSSLIVLV